MESRQKHDLKELWWLVLVLIVGIAVLCTSMLAGRRLSVEKSEEKCSWKSFTSKNSGHDDDESKFDTTTTDPQPLVDQVILVIIDALTPRVALGPKQLLSSQSNGKNTKESSSSSSSSSYFTYIRESIEETENRFFSSSSSGSSPSYSSSTFFPAQGFFSIADAPTTTAQRTKAMVTGTIPVLLEAGASFNSFSVEEDNLIEKLKGKSTVLGDDTWLRLFPDKESHWQEEHVFESFDVRDLHTVDDGILEHLNDVLTKTTMPASENNNASKKSSSPSPPKFIISHFLGVDHAGHRYNARNPHLYKKVDQLNKVLRNISSVLKERTVSHSSSSSSSSPKSTFLMVMGDHGMTESGDHGGSTPAETDTFLFTQIFDHHEEESSEKVVMSPSQLSAWSRNFSQTTRNDHCQISRLCRLTNKDSIEKYCDRVNCATFSSSSSSSKTATTPLTAIHQIDLVPTLAAIFDLPIPKQNLGRIVPEIMMQVLSSACYSFPGKKHHDRKKTLNCRNKKEIDKMIARLLACNVRQLHAAFCSEFSSQSSKFEKFCVFPESSSTNNLTEKYSDKNIIEEFSQKSSSSSSSTDEEDTNDHSPSSNIIAELDRVAAELSRAAREELTDVDTAAILVTLIIVGHVAFSALLFAMYSQPTSQRFIFALSSVVQRHASYAQLHKPKVESFKPNVRKYFRNWIVLIVASVVVDLMLHFAFECNSKIIFFFGVPLFVSNVMSLDHRHYAQIGYQVFMSPVTIKRKLFMTMMMMNQKKLPQHSSSSSFLSRFKVAPMCLAAFFIFVLFGWRIGIQESNSCIAREEVIVLTISILAMIFRQHLEGLVVVKEEERPKKAVLSLSRWHKIIIIGFLLSLSLALGRRLRDFDSHFIDGQSLTQKIFASPLSSFSLFSPNYWFLFSSSSAHRNLQAEEIIIAHREAQEGGTSGGGSFRQNWNIVLNFISWLCIETPFIHLLLCGTLVLLFIFTKIIKIQFIKNISWSIFFSVFFFWNVVVSNTTSLPAFILQCVTLFLWARWFPLARGRILGRIHNNHKVDDIENENNKMSIRNNNNSNNIIDRNSNDSPIRNLQLCNTLDGLVLHLFGWVFFFASGFHCMFSTIDWNVAFIGVGSGSSVNMVLGGILIFVHTFRSFIVVNVVGIYVDSIQQVDSDQKREKKIRIDESDRTGSDDDDDDDDDMKRQKKNIIIDDEDGSEKSSASVSFSSYYTNTTPTTSTVGLYPSFLFISFALTCSMMHSMTRHRGHLMVWEVFFPRFAFEIGTFCCAILGLTVKQFFCV